MTLHECAAERKRKFLWQEFDNFIRLAEIGGSICGAIWFFRNGRGFAAIANRKPD
jgi:hypothetical protein